MSTFRGLGEVRRTGCSARSTPIPLLAHARGRRCGQGQPDPGRPGLGARHRSRPIRRRPGAARSACSGAEAPKLRLAGIAWPRPIAFSRSSSGRRTRPLRPPGRGHRLAWLLPAHAPRRRGRQGSTVRYKNRTLQIPADRHRHHYVKAQVRVHEYPDGHLAVFHGPRCLARYRADGETIDDGLQAA